MRPSRPLLPAALLVAAAAATVATAATAATASPAEPVLAGDAAVLPMGTGRSMQAVGWAASSCGAVEVVVEVDGDVFVRGAPFLAWSGVPEAARALPNGSTPGFQVELPPGRWAPGEHLVVVRAAGCGVSRDLARATLRTPQPTSAVAGSAILLLALAPAILGGLVLARRPAHERSVRWLPLVAAIGWVGSFAAILIGGRLPGPFGPPGAVPFGALANWDGRWYLRIAHEGYAAVAPSSWNYFPLYPVLLRILSSLPGPDLLIASLANGVLFAGFVILLRRLWPTQEDGIVLVLLLPAALFFVPLYTESLFLFLAAGFLLAMRRSRPLVAFPLGFLAGATRVVGFGLCLVALDAIRERRWRDAAAALGPLAGFAAWCLWLRLSSGDALLFIRGQVAMGRSTRPHPGRLVDALRDEFLWSGSRGVLDALMFFGVVAGATILFVRGRRGEALYAALCVGIPLASQRLLSMDRYALAAFPALVALGASLRPGRVLAAIAIAEMAILFWLAAQFGRQIFVG